jgi:hypothetical protein
MHSAAIHRCCTVAKSFGRLSRSVHGFNTPRGLSCVNPRCRTASLAISARFLESQEDNEKAANRRLLHRPEAKGPAALTSAWPRGP